MTDHLLPSNATAEEIALSLSVSRGLEPERIKTLWLPYECPADNLPWLAWAFHVDDWDDSWPESVRRKVVADSIEIHRRKGTPWAVERALADIGYPTELDDDTGAAYIFNIAVSLSEGANVANVYAKALAAAMKYKNTRSHIGSISLGSRTELTSKASAACVFGAKCEIQPWSVAGETNEVPFRAGAAAEQHLYVNIQAAA